MSCHRASRHRYVLWRSSQIITGTGKRSGPSTCRHALAQDLRLPVLAPPQRQQRNRCAILSPAAPYWPATRSLTDLNGVAARYQTGCETPIAALGGLRRMATSKMGRLVLKHCSRGRQKMEAGRLCPDSLESDIRSTRPPTGVPEPRYSSRSRPRRDRGETATDSILSRLAPITSAPAPIPETLDNIDTLAQSGTTFQLGVCR
jgi:hypothetical protein